MMYAVAAFVIPEEINASISRTQSAKLKECGKNGELTPAMVKLILSEEKPIKSAIILRTHTAGKR